MQTDYPELEGKNIIMVGDGNAYSGVQKTLNGLVAGCNYYVGITIVNASDKKHELLCLNRKLLFNDMVAPVSEEMYEKMFNFIVEKIKGGTYDRGSVSKIRFGTRTLGMNGTMAVCPFK